MDQKLLRTFNEMQIDEIRRYQRRLQEQGDGTPDHDQAAMEWIRQHSARFRRRFLAQLDTTQYETDQEGFN